MAKKESWEADNWRNEAESDPSEREDAHEPRASEGWEAYVPEFVKRSLFGARESNHPEGASREGASREGASREGGGREEGGKGWLSREVARELAKLPREVAREMARVMLAQADRLKAETSKAIAHELRGFLGQLDLWKELRKAMDGTTLEIEMKVRFRSEDGQRLESEIEHLHVDRMDTEPSVSSAAGQQAEQQEAMSTLQTAKEPAATVPNPPNKKADASDTTASPSSNEPKKGAVDHSATSTENANNAVREKAKTIPAVVAKEAKEL